MTVKSQIHKAACRAYAWAEKHWFAKLVYEDAPLVRLLDFTAGSKCKYCMAVRAGMIGFGLGFGGLIGVFCIVAAVLLALAESNFCKEE